MPDPFFASNKSRKRKRTDPPSSSKKFARPSNGKPLSGKPNKGALSSKSKRRDEELSDETNDDDDGAGLEDMDLRAPDIDPDAYESGEEDQDETPAEKRLRLAKLYLESVKQSLNLGMLYSSLLSLASRPQYFFAFHSRRRIRCGRDRPRTHFCSS